VIAEETGPYAKRRWKQVQYLATVFWKRWTNEYLLQLQERQKWIRPKINFKLGDIVLVVDNSRPRNSWPMGRVIKTIADKTGVVRQVEVCTKSSVLKRPVHKLCMLLEADDPQYTHEKTEAEARKDSEESEARKDSEESEARKDPEATEEKKMCDNVEEPGC
jgi:hypothetical protein